MTTQAAEEPENQTEEEPEADWTMITCQICGAEGHAALQCPLIQIPRVPDLTETDSSLG